jgi:small conductance mechanosensitive channel
MRRIARITLVAALSILLAGLISAPSAAEGDVGEAHQPVTTADPQIPVDELALLLKPLTREELLVEAAAWQGLLKDKAEEIAYAEIAVKRQNREIKKAGEIQDRAEEAQERLEEVKKTTAVAKASGDPERVRAVAAAAREAQETMGEVSASVEEAATAAEKTAEVRAKLREETSRGLDETAAAADRAHEAVGRIQSAVEAADPDSEKSIKRAASEARQASEEARQATRVATDKATEAAQRAGVSAESERALESAANAMERAQEAKREEKVLLLEKVNDLREQRTVIIDRLKAVLDELEAKTDTDDAETLAKISDHRRYISAVSGIRVDVKDTTSAWAAIKGWLVSEEGGLRWAKNLGAFFGILLAAWLLSKLLSRALHRGLRVAGRVSRLLEAFLVGAVRWVVMIVGLIMALAALEVSIGPLLAIVGAVGFVIAFALQDSLGNFASGLMILFFRPFDEGDVVDAGGVSGKVISMNLVATTIKTFDNKAMVVPNNKIWKDVITNATGVDIRRVDMEFGIGYEDDMDQAQAILEQIVADHPKILAEPAPTIRMNTLAESSVNFICRPWVTTADYWDVYWDVTKAVKQRFDAKGIGIPFPQRDVHLYVEESGGRAGPAELVRGMAGAERANPHSHEPDRDDSGARG